MTTLNHTQINNNSVLKTKICIIGSGLSAQIIASSLRDFEITMIDSGKSDYDQSIQSLNDIEEVGIPFRKNNKNRIRQLGGSANLWANQLMYIDKDILNHRDWITKDFSFPFNEDVINQYYKRIFELVYKKNFNNLNYQNLNITNNKDLFLENEFINTKIFGFNNHFWPSKIEKFNSKSTFTKKIINLKNIKFLENFTATEMKINNEIQEIESVKVCSGDKTLFIKANYFILSAGAMENARILLNNSKSNKILQNPNIGRYFMDHPRITLGELIINKEIPLSNLLGIKNLNYNFRRSIKLTNKYQEEKKILDGYAFLDPKFEPEDINNFEFFLNEIKKLLKLKGLPKINKILFNYKKNFEQVYLMLGAQVSSSKLNFILQNFFNRKNYSFSFNKMHVNYQSEQYPNYESKIYLSKNKDYYNQNKLIVDWQLKDIDYKTYDEFSLALKNKFNTNSLIKFNEYKERKITDASHHSGTTRMSINKLDGVVNKNCKLHDLKNIFVSGNSVLRTTGSANPGLTNMAISLHIAKHIRSLI
jgi:hypothetical protein